MGFWRDLIRGRPIPTEQRTIGDLPWSTGGLYGSATVTQDRALALVPVFGAARIIAGTISTLPLKPYRKIGEQRQPMGSLPQLFAQLADAGELVPWLHRCLVSLVLRGNAYGLITERDGFEFPTRIDWLNPADVDVDDARSAIRPVWFWKGREVPREDIAHIPWFPVAGRTAGLSPIAAFASTVGLGHATRDYGQSWFDNGGFPPGTFQNTAQTVGQPQADVIKARLREAIRTRSPLVYGNDWKYDPVTVPPNEAQFVEAMKFNANDWGTIYGLPPEYLGGSRGDSLTYSTVELNQIERLQALQPWMVVLEHAFGALLPQRQYVRFNGDATVRMDTKSRHEVYQIDAAIGLRTIDEMRALEELPPLPKPKPVPPSPSDQGQPPNGQPSLNGQQPALNGQRSLVPAWSAPN